MNTSPYFKTARALLAADPKRHDWNWEKIIPEQNCFRFYRISVENDLFDGLVVRKYFGRIGSKNGKKMTVLPSNTVSIRNILELEIKRRLQKHYVLETQVLDRPQDVNTRKARLAPVRHSSLLA